MDRSGNSDMIGASIVLPLATIEEDMNENDNNNDDDDDDSSEQITLKVTDNDGKRVLLRKFCY